MNMSALSWTERKQLALIEQRKLELAAKAAGITYLMYMPRSFPHPSGLLHRSKPNARTSIWNPLQNDGDLFRLALAVPSVNLHEIIVRECQAGGDVARRVRDAFVDAVTGPVRVEDLACRSALPPAAPVARGDTVENRGPELPESHESESQPSTRPDA